MPVRLLLGVLVAVVLTGCRLDVAVEVMMQPDGTGTVTVDAIADAELVAQVPDLIDDLRLDDAEANGWVIEGPTEQANGSCDPPEHRPAGVGAPPTVRR